MAQEKFIRSHRARVKQAEEWRQRSPEKISIFDREAFVEFYLLEDIVRLYEYRMERERDKKVQTRAGEMSKQNNMAKFAAIINIFKSAIEIAWDHIDTGNYKAVWRSIPERQLATAANSIKYLPELRELATTLLRSLSDESVAAVEEWQKQQEELDRIEDHEANVARFKDLPTKDEIDALIRAVEIAIPDSKKASRINARPNV